MRIEDKISRTLKDAVQDEPLPKGVWEAFERRARRAQRVRIVVGSTLAAAAVIAAAFVVPRSLSGKPDDHAVAPAPSSMKAYFNSRFNYRIDYPSGWTVSAGKNDARFHPADLSDANSANGRPYFDVSISVTEARFDDAMGEVTKSPRPRGVTVETGTTLGRRYVLRKVRDTNTFEDGYTFEWFPNEVLYLSFGSDRGTLWQRYSAVETAMLASLAKADPSGWAHYSDFNTKWYLQSPPSWRYGFFEGEWDFYPNGLSALAKGDDTFAVSVIFVDEPFDKDAVTCAAGKRPCDEIRTRADLFDGRRWIERRTTDPRGGVRDVYLVDWSGADVFCAPRTVCAHGTLRVTITASTKALLDMHRADGEKILKTIHYGLDHAG